MEDVLSSLNQTFSEEQLLTTKLRMPSLSSHILARPRLHALLSKGTKRKLTLVSAPAGSGKTMLLCSWLTDPTYFTMPFAWLSLDETDNDPVRFWNYIWRALEQLHIGCDTQALIAFRKQQSCSPTSLLPYLINGLSTIATSFTLVLDDYHLIHASTIHQGLSFLLDHLPEPMHLVVSSREDPPLQLARLRARNQMVEIRADDLRFAPPEAAVFLTEVMGLDLKASDIDLLETRTEGWITGLQLAALSLHGRDSVHTSEFLTNFAGSHRYILDYLGEEVFLRQPEQIQGFLLYTSLLDRLSGSLCEAVTGDTNSQELLEQLERRNLFVIPIDEERRWYRYHQLFAEGLRHRLVTWQRQGKIPTSLALLHERASIWYEQHFLLAEAIHHALAAEDFDRAAELCEQIMQATLARGEFVTLRYWFGQIPQEILSYHPRLYAHYARALITCGQLEEARLHMEKAERSLKEHGKRLPPKERSSLIGQLAAGRGFFAYLQGDSAHIKALCQQIQELLPAGHLLRGGVPMLLGAAYLLEGDIFQAIANLTESSVRNLETGNHFFFIRTLLFLAQARAMQGSLQEAINTYKMVYRLKYEFSIRTDEEIEQPLCDIRSDILPQIDELMVGMAAYLYEKNMIDETEHYIQRSTLLHQNNINIVYKICAKIIMARIMQIRGEREQASLLMQQIMQLAQQHRLVCTAIFPSIGAAQARLALEQGDLEAAVRWERSLRSSERPLPPYPQEVNEIMLARLSLFQGRYEEAITQLSRLYTAVVAAGHMRNALEILILQALGEQALGKTTCALSTLGVALRLAQPDGYIRLFVDEGEPMYELLTRLRAQRGDATDFVDTLLRAFSSRKGCCSSPSLPEQAEHRQAQPSSEPLSPRELEVLQFVTGGASNQQIADRLIVTEGTVKRHLHNIFGKLGVNSRTQAIARGRELGLI